MASQKFKTDYRKRAKQENILEQPKIMVKETQKLNSKLFDADVEQIPIRKGFGEIF